MQINYKKLKIFKKKEGMSEEAVANLLSKNNEYLNLLSKFKTFKMKLLENELREELRLEKSSVEGLTSQNKKLEEQINELQHRISDLNDDLASLKQTSTYSFRDLKNKSAEYNELKNLFDSLIVQIDQTNLRIYTTFEENETLNTFKDNLSIENKQLIDQTTKQKKEIEDHVTVNAKLTDIIANNQLTIDQLNTNIEELNKGSNSQRTRPMKESIKETLKGQNLGIQGYKRTIDEQAVEINRLKKDVIDLKNNLDKLKNNLCDLKNVKDIEEKKYIKINTELKKDKNKLETDKITLNKDKEALTRRIEALQTNERELKNQNSSLTEKNRVLRKENKKRVKEFNKVKVNAKELEITAEKMKMTFDKEICTVKDQMELLKTNLGDELNSVKKFNLELTTKNENLNSQITDLNHVNSTISDENSKKDAQINQLTKEQEVFLAFQNALNHKLEETEKNNSVALAALAEKEIEIAKQKGELAKQKGELTKKQEELANLQEGFNKLKTITEVMETQYSIYEEEYQLRMKQFKVMLPFFNNSMDLALTLLSNMDEKTRDKYLKGGQKFSTITPAPKETNQPNNHISNTTNSINNNNNNNNN